MTNRRRTLSASAFLAFAASLSLFPVACMSPDSRPGKDEPPIIPVDPDGSEVARKASVYLDKGVRDTVIWDSAWSPFSDPQGTRTGYYRLPFMGTDLLLRRTNGGWLSKETCGGWPTDFHYLAAAPGQSLFLVNEPCEGIRRLDRWILQPVDHYEIYNGGPCAPDRAMNYQRCLILQEGDRRLKISAELGGGRGTPMHRLLIGREMSLQEIQDPPLDSQFTSAGLRASFILGEAPALVSGADAGTGPDALREIAFQGAHLRFRFTPSQAYYGGDAQDSVVLAPGQTLFRAGTSCEEFSVWDPEDMVPVAGYRIRGFSEYGYENAGFDRERECLLFRDGNIHVKITPWMNRHQNGPVQMMDLELMAPSR